jgi:uncharacterized protein YndB with AHSA1/START domain
MTASGFTASVVVAASAESVFRYFTVPELFGAWFVVDGFVTPADEIRLDPRPGGAISGVMVSVDGTDRVPFALRYGRLDPPRTAQFAFEQPEDTVTVVVQTLDDGRTHIGYHQPYGDPNRVEGAQSMLNALAESIPQGPAGSGGYAGLVKRLRVPDGFVAPTELAFGNLRAHALTREDLDDDVAGINASLDLIRRTRGGLWPTQPVTAEGNYIDLVWHECEFRDDKSYSYAVYDDAGTYLGCAYLYPVGARTPLTPELLARDVDVSWWVTPAAYDRGLYRTVYEALQEWVRTSFPFTDPHFSNIEIPPN